MHQTTKTTTETSNANLRYPNSLTPSPTVAIQDHVHDQMDRRGPPKQGERGLIIDMASQTESQRPLTICKGPPTSEYTTQSRNLMASEILP